MRWSAWAAGLAGFLVAPLAGTGCVGDEPPARIGEAQAPQRSPAWRTSVGLDYNRDGLGDLLWDDRVTNRIAVWLMDGTHVLARGAEIHGPPGDGWTVVPAGDFNGDGLFDVLWSDPGANRIAVWLLNGTQVFARGPEIPGPPGDGWTAYSGIDFNHDDIADVLWTNPTTNRAVVWLMNGTQVFARGPEIPGPPGQGWALKTFGDFNHDGLTDIAWYNAQTNRLTVWLMAGTHVLATGPEIPGPPGQGWSPVPTGDFNLDGMIDVLWDNRTTNQIVLWLMDGVHVLARGPEISGPPGNGWSVVPARDFNGDGMADLAWNDPAANKVSVWLMNGTRVLAPGSEIAGPTD